MQDQIKHAARILNSGEVIGMPTETVYGLAARIDLEGAVKKVFLTKKRPFFDPLIVHVSSVDQARALVTEWPLAAEILAQKFWPGPLTLVLPKSQKVSSLITAGLGTVGIRMPRHPMALELINETGCPLAAPSANKFGKTSPTCAEHVRKEFSEENIFVLDGGDCEVGLESTVLLIEGETLQIRLSILREGFVTKSKIESALKAKGLEFEFFYASKAASPGHMKHHYMPSVPFILLRKPPSSLEILKSEVLQKISSLPEQIEGVQIVKPSKIEKIECLRLSDDPALASREFYGSLRALAEKKPDLIYFILTDKMKSEEWMALMDRMTKAASLAL